MKKRKRSLSHDKYVEQFTKVWVRRLLIFLIACVIWTYLLGMFSHFLSIDPTIIQSLVDLSKSAMEIILGVILGYMCKAFFETKEEEKMKILQSNQTESSDINGNNN